MKYFILILTVILIGCTSSVSESSKKTDSKPSFQSSKEEADVDLPFVSSFEIVFVPLSFEEIRKKNNKNPASRIPKEYLIERAAILIELGLSPEFSMFYIGEFKGGYLFWAGQDGKQALLMAKSIEFEQLKIVYEVTCGSPYEEESGVVWCPNCQIIDSETKEVAIECVTLKTRTFKGVDTISVDTFFVNQLGAR